MAMTSNKTRVLQNGTEANVSDNFVNCFRERRKDQSLDLDFEVYKTPHTLQSLIFDLNLLLTDS